MDSCNSVGALVDPQVPAYLMSTAKEADTKAAYETSIHFARSQLVPFINDVDWASNLRASQLHQLPGLAANQSLTTSQLHQLPDSQPH